MERASLGEVVGALARHPIRELLWKWNYKAAVTSAATRGTIFFAATASVGLRAAIGALGAEIIFRFATAGFYGALTQAFRRVHPPRVGSIAAMILLPVVAHGLEWLVHFSRGTPNLAAAITISIAFTILSTQFNLFAMRHGVLVVGERDAASFARDLRRLPKLLLDWTLFCGRVKRVGEDATSY